MSKPKFRPMATAPRDGRAVIILMISDQLYRAKPLKRRGILSWVDTKSGRYAEEDAIVGWYPVPELPDGVERIQKSKQGRKHEAT